jgi:hypothetical protein
MRGLIFLMVIADFQFLSCHGFLYVFNNNKFMLSSFDRQNMCLMAFDEYLSQKLESIKRTYVALTERLGGKVLVLNATLPFGISTPFIKIWH